MSSITTETAAESAPASAGESAIAPRTALLLVAGLTMLQTLATDLYLPTLPGIAADFGESVAAVQWTMSAFIAGFAVWQLIAGPLSDRFGRQPIVLGGAATFCAASVLCAAAPTLPVLIAGRLLQALGACSALVGARAIARDLFEPSAGARLLASAGTIAALAPLLGPVTGALLFQAFGWRSSFALLAALSFAVTWFTALHYRETNRHRDRADLAVGPTLATYARIARSPTFRAYALLTSSSYAGLFAFLSGSSFVLIRIFGFSVLAFALSFACLVSGYLFGTLLCRRLVPHLGVQRTARLGAAAQGCAGMTMAALALLGILDPLAIMGPMFFYFFAHGVLQPPGQAGSVAPFARNAGAAAALLGCTMMTFAALVGIVIGATYNGTVYPLTLTIGAASALTALLGSTLVRRHGQLGH